MDEDGDLTPEDQAEVVAALGVAPEDFDFLWEYALGVEWLLFDPEDEDRVLQGETADDWATGDDESVFGVWSSTMAAVLGETLELYGPEPEFDADADDDEGDGEGDDEEFNFTGQGMAIAILLFLARREGLTGDEFTEVLWENAAGGDIDEDDEELSEELAEARERWEEEYGDPARLLLDKLHTVLAITEEDDVIRLTPLALAALHEQLVEAGVDIPTAAADRRRADRQPSCWRWPRASATPSSRPRRRRGWSPAATSRPPGSCSSSPPRASRASGCWRWRWSPRSAPRPPRPCARA